MRRQSSPPRPEIGKLGFRRGGCGTISEPFPLEGGRAGLGVNARATQDDELAAQRRHPQPDPFELRQRRRGGRGDLWTTMPDPDDPFELTSGPDQLSLFGAGEDRMQPPAQRFAPDPELVRQRLGALLALARAAKSMPWPRTRRPHVADRLPPDGQLAPRRRG